MGAEAGATPERSVCLLVLNYNGREHLDVCLSSALEAVQRYGRPCPVVLVDNRSTEPDVEYVRTRYPAVEICVADSNDFLFSLNAVVRDRKEDVVLILNNDTRVAADFIQPLVRYFDDTHVFAVTAKVYDWVGRVTTGKRRGFFRHFWFYKKWDYAFQKPGLTLDACGGSSAFNRAHFLELGGFDPLYRPGYWEDTDLSYRAWQRGWKVIYEPQSVVYHKVSASFDKHYGRDTVTRLIRRNEILFTVKNCGGPLFIFFYIALLPLRALRSFFTGNRPLTGGALDAWKRLPEAFSRRAATRRYYRRPEREFLREIREDDDAMWDVKIELRKAVRP